MRQSTKRILTTHVGSLPRSEAVTNMVFAEEKGERMEPAARHALLAQAVDAVVARQCEAGVDVVSDGEMSKISYATYIKDRITGFEGDSPRRPPADLEEYPGFLQRQAASGGTPTYRRPNALVKSRSRTWDRWKRTWAISAPPWTATYPPKRS